jgi:hypothetical protein
MRFFFIAGLIIVASSCQKEPNDRQIITKEWVYVEVKNQGTSGGIDYYRYGKIKSSIVPKIISNSKTTGLFVLEEMRYINLQDKIEIYEDDEYAGTDVFRIQDIIMLQKLKEDPILTADTSELTKRSLDYRLNLK